MCGALQTRVTTCGAGAAVLTQPFGGVADQMPGSRAGHSFERAVRLL